MKRRIGLIAVLQENNTFHPNLTQLAHFQRDLLIEGPEVLKGFARSQHEMGGFIESLAEDPTVETVGVFAARAEPYGTIDATCWDELMQRLDSALDRYGPYDGMLVAPHGANVAENARDADGHWLGRLRNRLGSKIPIVGTLDLHANVSVDMVDATDALIGYRTNPHLDQKECGELAGNVLLKTLHGKCAPVQTLVQLPLCPNIERQATSEPHGEALARIARGIEKSHPAMISVSCLYGFPYADVTEMGASVISVANGDRDLAYRCGHEMAGYWWSIREQFSGQLISINEAIDFARQRLKSSPGKPVGLLDMGDNVGGGGPGDATAIMHAWLNDNRNRDLAILSVITDPEAVCFANQAGRGGRIRMAIGGKLNPSIHGEPIEDSYLVQSLSDGKFREDGVTHGGYRDFDQGATAVLIGSRGQTIVATTYRVGPMSLQQLLSQDIDPLNFSAIVIKGVHAPVFAYAPVCSQLIRVNTKGLTSADPWHFEYVHRRIPLFPFERD